MERETLEMALIGYRSQVTALSEKITAIEQELRGAAPGKLKALLSTRINRGVLARKPAAAGGTHRPRR